RDGQSITCRAWIQELLDEVTPLAQDLDLMEQLSPLHVVLQEGNQAMQWLQGYSTGQSVQELIQEGIRAMNAEELATIKSEAVLG
ncbi:MAG: putative glutamate--cysteine ligase, partial [Prochlorococcus sp.]